MINQCDKVLAASEAVEKTCKEAVATIDAFQAEVKARHDRWTAEDKMRNEPWSVAIVECGGFRYDICGQATGRAQGEWPGFGLIEASNFCGTEHFKRFIANPPKTFRVTVDGVKAELVVDGEWCDGSFTPHNPHGWGGTLSSVRVAKAKFKVKVVAS